MISPLKKQNELASLKSKDPFPTVHQPNDQYYYTASSMKSQEKKSFDFSIYYMQFIIFDTLFI